MKTPLSFSLSPGISSVGHSVYNMRLISEAEAEAAMDYGGPFSPFHTTSNEKRTRFAGLFFPPPAATASGF